MTIEVRQAAATDIDTVSSILLEAATWLEEREMPMWKAHESLPERIAQDVREGLFFLGEYASEPAGTIKFQIADVEFWPDVPENESAFIHRLAVRRRFAGGAVSTALLSWALERTASLGRRYLRLDCEASRRKLRDIYERFGFQHHSDRDVGPYFVSRYQFRLPAVTEETHRETYRQEDRLRVRDLSVDDTFLVNGYWANQTPADVDRMSLDPSKIPTPYLQVDDVKKLLDVPFNERTSDLLIWELNRQVVGMSSLRNIRYGHYGEIHLHLIEPHLRRSGYGHRFFALTLREFFRRFQLQRIVCEPSSGNPGPNRLLQKLGFRIANTYRTIPGPLNREHEVNRYEITPARMAALVPDA